MIGFYLMNMRDRSYNVKNGRILCLGKPKHTNNGHASQSI